jgi:NAD(P)H dehydrogenase (quinone)
MKHAIIVGHPDTSSFTLAMANAYATCLSAHGHETIMRDLYQLEFDPCLKLSEIPNRPGWAPAPDVVAERRPLADANAFAFVSIRRQQSSKAISIASSARASAMPICVQEATDRS